MLKKPLAVVILIILSLAHFESKSDVVESSAQSFYLKIERLVPTTTEIAYKQFLNVDAWWNGDHTWFGEAAGLYIEPEAGGCFCERNGDQSALHMIVSYINPGKEVRLIGGLGPLQGMAIHGAMSFRFLPVDKTSTSDAATRIVFEYKVMGASGLETLAEIVNTVQTMQLERLQASLDN